MPFSRSSKKRAIRDMEQDSATDGNCVLEQQQTMDSAVEHWTAQNGTKGCLRFGEYSTQLSKSAQIIIMWVSRSVNQGSISSKERNISFTAFRRLWGPTSLQINEYRSSYKMVKLSYTMKAYRGVDV
jgi:hypothetical protein